VLREQTIREFVLSTDGSRLIYHAQFRGRAAGTDAASLPRWHSHHAPAHVALERCGGGRGGYPSGGEYLWVAGAGRAKISDLHGVKPHDFDPAKNIR